MPEPIALSALGGFLVKSAWNAIKQAASGTIGNRADAAVVGLLDLHRNHDIARALEQAWRESVDELFGEFEQSRPFHALASSEQELVRARRAAWKQSDTLEAVMFASAEVGGEGSFDVARIALREPEALTQSWTDTLRRQGLWEGSPPGLNVLLEAGLVNCLLRHFIEIGIKRDSMARDAVFFQQFLQIRVSQEEQERLLTELREAILGGAWLAALRESVAGAIKAALNPAVDRLERQVDRLSGLPAGGSRRPPTPVPATPICLGREDEIDALSTGVLGPAAFAACLLGPPGVGKSTLSLAVLNSAAVVRRFKARRYFVRCESARTGDEFCVAVAAALGFPPETAQWPAALAELAREPVVIALDNAETPHHASASEFLPRLAELRGVPTLRLLASFRGGERPASRPWDQVIHVGLLPPELARESFLQQAGSEFEADPLLGKVAEAIAERLPLALTVLAHQAQGERSLEPLVRRWNAERAKLLTLPGATDRGFNLLVSVGTSLSDPRLSEAGRRLAALLGLHTSGMSCAAASRIHGASYEGARRDLTVTLGLAMETPDSRLRMLAPVRECVAALIRPDAQDLALWTAHYVELVKQEGWKVGSDGGASAMQTLAPEAASVEAVVALGLDDPFFADARLFVQALAEFMRFTGLGTTHLLEQIATHSHGRQDHALRANCIQSIGDIALARSDHNEARKRYDEALTLYRRVGFVLGEANCTQCIGDIALRSSDHDQARKCYDEALVTYRRLGAVLGEANCIRCLGDLAFRRSEHDQARKRYDEALALYRRLGAILGEANCIQCLGDIALARSEQDEARKRYDEALTLYRRVGVVLGEANCIQRIGDIARRRFDFDEARMRYNEALPLYRHVGDVLGEANCIRCLGYLALRSSDHDQARNCYDEALILHRRIGDVMGQANCIRCLGDLALHSSDHDQAQKCYDEALALCRRGGDMLGEADSIQSLGNAALARSDHDQARKCYDEALALYRRIGDMHGEANCMKGLGDIALCSSEHEEARRRFDEALQLYSRIPEPYSMGMTSRRLARLSADRTERNRHAAAARTAWTSIGRSDLLAALDDEFPAS